MNKNFIFNRVLGLKFLYENFNYYFNKNRIELFFVNSKKELQNLNITKKFDTFVLKRSGNINKIFISDIKCKDNRFFNNFEELKKGACEFDDNFIFCVECHKFKAGENYYSDHLAIAQFSTQKLCDMCDRISFIPSYNPGVSTRDNQPYFVVEFPYDSGSTFRTVIRKDTGLKDNNLTNYSAWYLINQIHNMIDSIREFLLEKEIHNIFQLIVRFDSYLNLLPIDFRTSEAWFNSNK